ncbi:DUF4249 family protein [Aquimarina aquimarini]|uniref:DUF4249 family protein n=1 Tax=Aquimarina aquimarini TaxID=1191734 RepID=UPI000D54B7B0|nr:DUF4249 family protein [Aquimarina aquimarini]
MKKLITLILGILVLVSCEDVVEVDVPNGKPKLVIDASFELYLNETPIEFDPKVRLTLSASFFDQNIPEVQGATVYITNTNNNTIINFEQVPDSGLYVPAEEFPIPQFGTTYELTVVYNNETYKATTQLIPTVSIDNIEQGENTLFDNETEIIIFFTDDGTRNDFYLFDFDFNLFLASEDRFYQGKPFNFSYFYEDMVNGRDLTIKILGIDKRYYKYTSLLIEQSDQQGGNPFQTPPAQLRGNIINTTNTDNYALGYFNLSEANKFDITIKN